MKFSRTGKSFAISLTLSCLFYFHGIWNVLFPVVGIRAWSVDYSPTEATALLILISATCLILFFGIILFDRVSPGRAKTEVRILFVLVASASFGSVSFQIVYQLIPINEPFINYLVPLLVLAICAITAIPETNKVEAVYERMRAILTILAPAAFLLLVQCVSVSLSSPPKANAIVEKFDNPMLKRPGILLILFDELDVAAMHARPPDVKMPAFEKFQAESFVGKAAFPPAEDTRDSIPSLLYGRIIPRTERGVFESLTSFAENDTSDYFRTGEKSIVSDLNNLGMNSAAVGWYIPYERLFGSENTFGEWSMEQAQRCSSLAACCSSIWEKARSGLPLGNPLSVINLGDYAAELERIGSERQMQRNNFLMGQAKTLLANPHYDLRLLHFSVPHSPYIKANNSARDPNYFDHLAVVDRDLAEILYQVEVNEATKNTTIIVSSDHWWRTKTPEKFSHLAPDDAKAAAEDNRIPFIVKFPGEDRSWVFEPAFNTAAMRDIIFSIAKRDIDSNEKLHQFLLSNIEAHPDRAAFRPQWSKKEF